MFLTPPRPHASHRLSRPTSGVLPNIEGVEGDMTLTTQTSIVGIDEQRNPQEGEQTDADQEAHEGEQVPISETARTSGEAAQAGQNAEADEKSHAVDIVNEGEVLFEGDENAQEKTAEVSDKGEEGPDSKGSHEESSETQAVGAAEADENSHKLDTATKANFHMTTVWMRRQAKIHQQVGSLSKAKQLTKSTHRHQAANRRGNSQKRE